MIAALNSTEAGESTKTYLPGPTAAGMAGSTSPDIAAFSTTGIGAFSSLQFAAPTTAAIAALTTVQAPIIALTRMLALNYELVRNDFRRLQL